MGEGPIRLTGAYDIPIQLHADVVAEIKVIVNEDAIIAAVETEAEAEEVLDYDAEEAEVVETVIDDTAMEGVTPEEAAALEIDVEEPEAETPAS